MQRKNSQRVLFLSSADAESTVAINDEFVSRLNSNSEDIEFVWSNYNNIGIELTPSYFKVYLLSTGEELKCFDLVYYKSYFRYQSQAVAILEYMRQHKVKYIGSELNNYIPTCKLTQLARLFCHGLAIPDTIYLPKQHYLDRYNCLVDKLGSPFIFKDVSGRTGNDNFLISSFDQFKEVLATSSPDHFIAQNFIPNDRDLRIIVLSGQIKMVIQRKRRYQTTHLNNTSKGAESTLIDVNNLDGQAGKLALEAAKAMGRDVAGVDIMINSQTGKPYILEVNASPQLGSGAFIDEKIQMIIDFCKDTLKN